jgi:hypothetical protein
MMWILASVPLFAQFAVKNPATVCAREHQKDAARVGQFVFRTYLSKDGACLQVFRGDNVIFRRTIDSPQGYTLGQSANKRDQVPAIANGTDITGRGRPNMITSFYTGGAHCCLTHYVFELEPEFKLVATLDARDTWPAYFADLDGNHRYYYLAEDWTFAYRYGSFAGSPVHSVVLRFADDSKGGGYHLALDKMQRTAPTPAEWKKALGRVRDEQHLEDTNMANNLRSVLWQEVLDLIYTGHSDLAWKFLDEVGSKAQQGNNDLEGFCSTLKASPYWLDLEKAIQTVPPACANAKP